MKGIEAHQRELIDKRYRYNKPAIESVPWNARMMRALDPFGNKLLFDDRERDSDEERGR